MLNKNTMIPEQDAALIIFMKNPQPGKVKTRLAKTIGEGEAFEVYLKLLDHTRNVASDIPVDTHVFYSDFIDDDDEWSDVQYFKHLQRGRDLGERMHHAFAKIFDRGYRKVVIIGSDCFELRAKHIIRAFDILNRFEAVIGPARDGGYYLLGLRRLVSSVFNNKNWSTDSVFEETIKDFQEENIIWQELPVLRDVDTLKDWEELT